VPSKDRISLRRTVLYDEETKSFCSCEGPFWKTCSLRVIGQLPCQDAIVSITPVKRTEIDPAAPGVKSIDESLSTLTDSLRNLEDKFKI
jgi:hypothetical protein